ncbi:MAG: sulfite exporter TauE/SafE family protein [Flavobacteriales bacterium]|nr:sulfite exporter TauE/SafE family protein [Flavobacteriales bacterium]
MVEAFKEYYLFYLLTLFAEILGTVSGFGSSILFVPLAAIFFDFDTVLGLTAIFHVFSNLFKVTLFRSGIDKNITLKLGIPAVIFVIIGALLTQYIATTNLSLGMSIVLLGTAIFLLAYQNKTLKSTDRNLYTGGAFSGFAAGIFGSGGSIRGLTLSAFNLKKETFVATSAAIDLGVDLSRAVVYAFNGFVQLDFLIILAPLIGISYLGSWLGKLILEKLSQDTFKYIALGTISLTAIYQIITYFNIW